MNSEFDIIHRYFKRIDSRAILGIGDDAALINIAPGAELAISTDTLVCGRHFFADADPNKLGHKSLAVNLSDMAAMGAEPRWALLALTLPEALVQPQQTWLQQFSAGFFALADRHCIELIGGDTTAGPLNINIQIIGTVDAGQALRRSGARPDDDIWVSGVLGSAALALQHELGNIALADAEIDNCMSALLTPVPRIDLGRRLIGLAHSAIDISDGLVADLGHILESSHVSGVIHLADIPCLPQLKIRLTQPLAVHCLLAGGDDYELCFTAPRVHREQINKLAIELKIPLTRIGKILIGEEGLIVKDAHDVVLTLEHTGYDHFSARSR
ncbi:MAG: thiamine-phosphate kinase [Nitrosomonas sp.]|nr:MAG: thiamine-phosphate kinase [Nitrosomonas sp.]